MTEIEINKEIDSITMPENLRISQMVREHRSCCENPAHKFEYYNFAFGQSPFHIPPPITEALRASADNGNYTVADGIMDLRKAISGFNRRHFGLDIDPERIMVGPGTKQLIYLALEIISGDVIIPSPSWIGYLPQVKILKKPYHIYHLKPEHDYRIDPDGLESFLAGLPKIQHMLILNNPHNPTGAVHTKQELKKIADICRNHNTLILSDEIYALTTYDIKKFTSLGNIYPEGTFITNGLSKDRSAGGYRLGSCIFPQNDTEKMKSAFKKTAAKYTRT
ncbi:MAG: aminotransferase class I/II-fold pyridoxal phosphate-dependent enzyme [archaeon]